MLEKAAQEKVESTQRTRELLHWSAGAAGAVGVVTGVLGAIYFGRMIEKNDASSPYCDHNVCRQPGYAERQAARTAGDTATAFLVVGAVTLAYALVAIYVSPSLSRIKGDQSQVALDRAPSFW
jgi:hypothetical protein